MNSQKKTDPCISIQIKKQKLLALQMCPSWRLQASTPPQDNNLTINSQVVPDFELYVNGNVHIPVSGFF